MSAANTVFNAPLRPASDLADPAPRSPPRTPPKRGKGPIHESRHGVVGRRGQTKGGHRHERGADRIEDWHASGDDQRRHDQEAAADAEEA